MRYLLDTSALLAYHQDEAGADLVGRAFEERGKGEATITVSFMTLFEITYLALARRGAEYAAALLCKISSLELETVWPDEDLLWKAGEVKALGGLSVADAFIAASAMLTDAVLVHRDPEFARLEPPLQTLQLHDAGE